MPWLLALLLILIRAEEAMRLGTRRLIGLVLLVVVPLIARAQVVWQPTSPPLVTAENERWYLAAEPIIWAGAYFYPAGAQVFFNGNQMVRSGSFRGVPLYTDATREALSVVYVPLAGGLMQPYERRRTGELAGTTGNTAPAFPTDVGREGIAPEGIAVDIAQNPGPPDFARPYDVAPPGEPATSIRSGRTRPSVSGKAIAEGDRSIVEAPRTGARPRGLNGIWVDFEGGRWFAAGPAQVFDSTKFLERGLYHGFPVYARKGERASIYIPSVPGLVTPYKQRK